jgi:hypothetical protein
MDVKPDFKSCYQGLSKPERAAFASTAGTTTNYIDISLVHARKTPNLPLMGGLYRACLLFEFPLTWVDLLLFFSPEPTDGANVVVPRSNSTQ